MPGDINIIKIGIPDVLDVLKNRNGDEAIAVLGNIGELVPGMAEPVIAILSEREGENVSHWIGSIGQCADGAERAALEALVQRNDAEAAEQIKILLPENDVKKNQDDFRFKR